MYLLSGNITYNNGNISLLHTAIIINTCAKVLCNAEAIIQVKLFPWGQFLWFFLPLLIISFFPESFLGITKSVIFSGLGEQWANFTNFLWIVFLIAWWFGNFPFTDKGKFSQALLIITAGFSVRLTCSETRGMHIISGLPLPSWNNHKLPDSHLNSHKLVLSTG